jgi:hypothetical protein
MAAPILFGMERNRPAMGMLSRRAAAKPNADVSWTLLVEGVALNSLSMRATSRLGGANQTQFLAVV